MENLELLQKLATEINNNWSNEFSAIVQDNELRVKVDHLVVALADSNGEIDMVEDGYDEVFDKIVDLYSRIS